MAKKIISIHTNYCTEITPCQDINIDTVNSGSISFDSIKNDSCLKIGSFCVSHTMFEQGVFIRLNDDPAMAFAIYQSHGPRKRVVCCYLSKGHGSPASSDGINRLIQRRRL